MIAFSNESFDIESVCRSDLFICAIGYESRSYYIYNQIKESRNSDNTLVFTIDDFERYSETKNKIEEIKSANHKIEIVKYQDAQKVQNAIIATIKDLVCHSSSISVDIDYSSMPRGWYCKLPELLDGIIRDKDSVYFWYSAGIYPDSYEEFLTAGIESYELFSGKSSLTSNNNRAHIIGLSYDTIRTQGIISILDPEYIVACDAFSSSRPEIHDNVVSVNSSVLSQAAVHISLRIDDFCFMISKLKETVYELLWNADVILVPDGPKPLIFAMSIIPWAVNKKGVTCLHIKRNDAQFVARNIKPTGEVIGIKISSRQD